MLHFRFSRIIFNSIMIGIILCLQPLGVAWGAMRMGAVERSALDPVTFAQAVGGKESPISGASAPGGPAELVWTKLSRPGFRGVKFGEERELGERHLRIGFTENLTVGSVLVRGGGTLSTLKTDAVYPGNLMDESQWVPAERLTDGAVTHKEVDTEGYAIWVLPPATNTRALRFSHSPAPGDQEFAGWVGGVYVFQERLGNLAPQAFVQTVARDDISAKIVDESNNNQWKTWENSENGAVLPISLKNPEFITLSWPTVVKLDGICVLFGGFSSAHVEVFDGAATDSIHEASPEKWKLVSSWDNSSSLYPLPLGSHVFAFSKSVSTRALRLRIVHGDRSDHPHLADKGKEGRRIWLAELMAFSQLDDAALSTLILPKRTEEPPPIPVRFTLPEAGVVTLVLEDSQKKRVRNLVSETPFPAGDNIAWWDGSDDLLRDPDAARHGVYHIPTRLVAPGQYTVRGLWHQPLKLRYQFSIYSAGKPAWETMDKTGCWLTTHTPPTSVVAVPGSRTADGQPLVFMGASIAEGGHGLQWLQEDGTKLGGQGWVGGNWTGAPTLTVDLGPRADADHLCYVGSIFEGELRLTAKTRDFADVSVLQKKLAEDGDPNHPETITKPVELDHFDGGDRIHVLGGIAARDGQLVYSLVRQNELRVVDIKGNRESGRIPLINPRGLCFDAQGHLLALSGQKLVRFETLSEKPVPIISAGLEDPRHVTLDSKGRVFITDRGTSHQVKMFSSTGKRLMTLGVPGAPSVGPYEPRHLNHPNGIAVDSQDRIWVAESDNSPRRVSVWSNQAQLIRAFYGPTEYGGGGVLDPQDSSRFYYKGLEFKLNGNGTDQLVRIYSRPDPLLDAHGGHFMPDTPLYPIEQMARRYFTSCYTHNPTNGDDIAFIWQDGERQAHLVAALGNAHSWSVLREEEFRPHWPDGTKPELEHSSLEAHAAFTWTDSNQDGRPQPEEVRFLKSLCRGVTVMNDLAFVVSQWGPENVRFAATYDAHGFPVYDLEKPQSLGPAGGVPPSSGGNQSLTEPGGWTINTNAPEPFSPFGLGGKFQGEPRWSYPSAWPGLHASHEAAVPDRPGMVIGHTRLLGGFIQNKVGPLFCVNGNMGNMYLMTADGLFVGSLFHDIRVRPCWAAPIATRNMDVTDVSLHDENFWPSLTQTVDGNVFLVDGGRTSLVRVDGLESLTRLPEQEIHVGIPDLQRAREWFATVEVNRQHQRGSGVLAVPMRTQGPQIDGKLEDWPTSTQWAWIDSRGTRANFNSNSQPYEVSAALAVSNTHLFVAWRTQEEGLLTNSGETPQALFKHGGCLDIMLGTNAKATPDREKPVPGDQRLLITQVNDQTRALLYRANVPGTKQPIAFSSPWRTITLDVVNDVSQEVTLARDKGNFEISIPLTVLKWKPFVKQTYRGDLGILRGANFQTTQRIYWNNKATAITSDIPSEAELTPKLWGNWKVVKE